MPIPEGEEGEKETEKLFKTIINKNFPYLWKELDPQIQEANRTLNYFNPKLPSLRDIILTLSKINNKERILKTSRQKGQ